ncbi:asparagine synthetase B family protein [Streptomyces axinellae]|uniref:asparagine synthase (glutamine-hydrolyzing) n=1 Tax=Streptomyces axinellae TaxID=552788 RepID=A0ABP6DB36_9ACTN
MCGIGGVILKRRSATDRDGMMRRLRASLAHRGRSSAGGFTDERAALHCARHAVIAVEDARQPLLDSRRNLVMVGNGEILNYRDLVRRLPPERARRLRPGDLQVALELYAERGADAFEELRGPFALAAWDSRAGELTLVRDRLGERPLYYYDSPDFFAFASEIRCLAAALPPGLLHRDEAALLSFLGLGRMTDGRTPYREIRTVPAGAVLRIGGAGAGPRQLASLTPVSGLRPAPAGLEEIDELLARAHRRALVADQPVAVGFSGGIDSTAVLRAAQGGAGAAAVVTVYSELAPASDINLHRARELAPVLGVELTEVPFRMPTLDGAEDILNTTLDGPAAEPLVLHNDTLHAAARDHSAVLLGGHGADEVFGGYVRYAALRAEAEAVPTPKWLASSAWERWNRAAGWQRFLRDFGAPDLAAAAPVPADPLERPFPYADAEEGDRVLFGQALDLFRLMTYDNFRATDENGIARQVEVRSPFFDIDLVAGIYSLPVADRLGQGTPKPLLRRAFQGTPLAGAFTERKVGFDDHFSYSDWMVENWPRFSSAIVDGPLKGTGILRDGALDRLQERDWRTLWRLFSLSTWLTRAD